MSSDNERAWGVNGDYPPGSTFNSESQHTLSARVGQQQTHFYGDECSGGHWNEMDPNAGVEVPPGGESEYADDDKFQYPCGCVESHDSIVYCSDCAPEGISLQFVDESVDDDDQGGNKLDSGKPDFALIPGHALAEVAKVLGDGARRPEYGPDNWRGGLKLRRLISAALRHIYAFSDGQDYDPKSPFAPRCHLANAMCMLLFAYEMWRTRPDMDDRFIQPEHIVTPAFLSDEDAADYEDAGPDYEEEEAVIVRPLNTLTKKELFALIETMAGAALEVEDE